MVAVGDNVVFVDPVGKEHSALVTAVWGAPHGMVGDDGPKPSINVVFVTGDESQTDRYGRQIARNTSVVHASNQQAHGMFWREP